VVVVLAGLSTRPGRGLVGWAVAEVRDRVSKHPPVAPVAARASSAAPGASPEYVLDHDPGAYWAPAGAAVSAWVEVDFDRPVRLLDVIVTAGVSTDRQRFLAEGRPRELAMTVTRSRGGPSDTTLPLRDAPGQQRFPVKVSDAVRVRFTVTSTYGPRGHLCAVGELEFFGRR
jgi:hypothetical protein